MDSYIYMWFKSLSKGRILTEKFWKERILIEVQVGEKFPEIYIMKESRKNEKDSLVTYESFLLKI